MRFFAKKITHCVIQECSNFKFYPKKQTKMTTATAHGRLNIIGEHTDYNEGYVLPVAIAASVTFWVEKKAGTQGEIWTDDRTERLVFELNKVVPLPSGGWENYLLGVVAALQQRGAALSGFSGRFRGDVPQGSGVSASAALTCSFAKALNKLFDLKLDLLELAKVAQEAEHHFVGTQCGIMDQVVSLFGRTDAALLLDCRTLEHRFLPLQLGNYQFLLLNTGIKHRLADSAYNARRATCAAAVQTLKQQGANIQSLRDATLEQLQTLGTTTDAYRKCRHVLTENARVLAAAQCLENQNFLGLGALMYASHESLRTDYEVSCAELDFLVAFAKAETCILGSRMMGGGFGGCTINLIETAAVPTFVQKAKTAYQTAFGRTLSVV
jgi:galactokinase